jgi:hypothetical protein
MRYSNLIQKTVRNVFRNVILKVITWLLTVVVNAFAKETHLVLAVVAIVPMQDLVYSGFTL